jgi:2,3,4,5-tetrahydropyridine-2,6-dicarboxylate N-succinyltransferase
MQDIIESGFEALQNLSPKTVAPELKHAIETVLQSLEAGTLRVAEHDAEASLSAGHSVWRVHAWIKKAVLMSFRIRPNQLMPAQPQPFFDKVPLRFVEDSAEAFAQAGIRMVPGAVVRAGAHIGRDVVLMPSFVNIGAHVGAGSMVDSWATVGSCAQIGARVHLSGGVGIGGVLEPLQAAPTIIEDDCFIGARSEVVEGVIVEQGSVIGMGVYLGQSTKIYDRATGQISYGRIPAGSVVVAGALPSADGSHSLYCAVIVKQVDAKTRSKTSINELLRS